MNPRVAVASCSLLVLMLAGCGSSSGTSSTSSSAAAAATPSDQASDATVAEDPNSISPSCQPAVGGVNAITDAMSTLEATVLGDVSAAAGHDVQDLAEALALSESDQAVGDVFGQYKDEIDAQRQEFAAAVLASADCFPADFVSQAEAIKAGQS